MFRPLSGPNLFYFIMAPSGSGLEKIMVGDALVLYTEEPKSDSLSINMPIFSHGFRKNCSILPRNSGHLGLGVCGKFYHINFVKFCTVFSHGLWKNCPILPRNGLPGGSLKGCSANSTMFPFSHLLP